MVLLVELTSCRGQAAAERETDADGIAVRAAQLPQRLASSASRERGWRLLATQPVDDVLEQSPRPYKGAEAAGKVATQR